MAAPGAELPSARSGRRAGLPRMSRRGAVVAALVLTGALLVTGSLTWSAGRTSTVLGEQAVSVPGTAAAPGVAAAALVVGAAALALAIGRRVGAAVAGVALLGAAVLVGYSSMRFLADPAGPLEAAAAEVSGVPELLAPASVSASPYLTIVVAVLVALLGTVVLLTSGRWSAGGRRFERQGPTQAPSAETAGPARSDGPVGSVGRAGGRSEASRASDERTRAMDDWDALNRGEDPSES